MWIHSCPKDSNISHYDSFKQVEKSTGTTPAELLDAPQATPGIETAFKAYHSLREHTFPEIESYCRLTGVCLDPWEVEAIVSLAKFKGITPIWPLNTQT